MNASFKFNNKLTSNKCFICFLILFIIYVYIIYQFYIFVNIFFMIIFIFCQFSLSRRLN